MAQTDWVFGLHSIAAILANEPERILEIMVAKERNDDRMNKVVNLARKQRISVQFVQRKTLDERSKGEQHQGIMARAKAARVMTEADLDTIIENQNVPFLLVLDGVTDPHNLGACLRNADAAGVHAVIVPKDKSAAITPVVRKVAVGAAETVPLIQVTNLARTLKQIQQQGVWVIGTAGEAEQLIYDCKIQGPTALVMGAEGKGMRRLTRETCDELVKLPMAGSVSSLNVSVATGICLFEVVRQRA
ncbi:23S rRNA (guanosine(2251)-2'-O)-methyltransferase RlmB [Glaciecola petra]|uniref:23S rRNA (guanosine-2'-O-)-methyltransferase RlmB n=1 Tax=Glaciecola petra TaxID=3075602 RepID=A0ABU2ZSQ8_9ALTE|nr:23S rRNA (guanosine(2251)-2'-O)-methyltransferase RlmB [Aestuariibacter sp. P117]MDT0595344.1 23S rRNA (guanosine(2251)-2'-O)-methyltransferase RlmB [Aestuariibacter sp. P117]